MPEPDALDAALALFKDPVSARSMPNLSLPPGMDRVLAVAVGDEEALAAAERRSGIGRGPLQQAAGFFIEQALLFHDADSYRVLGAGRNATHEELRHNMALLMRWLHPDLQSLRSGPLDREVFTARISRAWEDLKTGERRSAYDLRHPPAGPSRPAPGSGRREARVSADSRGGTRNGAGKGVSGKASTGKAGAAKAGTAMGGSSRPASAGHATASGGAAKIRRPGGTNGAARRHPLPLSVNRIEGASFWVRLWGFLWRPR
ncbi:J domain-containing protein [Ancylobacter rudongensis]|uniref:DnaJ domain-containing protein n=1 Tax=Ancylobacter rudongensis TaxID=177413 RepID=A0A1G4UMG1_9HYPH|nr:DnaJ domain-containing protein [Ancylobacter rudongensis]SCW94841.1 DnaJ domain-containing protein [Ancylobacter rudongensis]